jgi:signal peptidase II
VPIDSLSRTVAPFVIGAVVVGLDAGSKYWAREELAHRTIHVAGPVRFELSYNSGVSFSIAHTAPLVAVVLALMALAAVTAVAIFSRKGWPAVGFGLLIGGGYANLLDRLTSHSHKVTDFIKVSSFPTFNVADAAITLGVIVLIVTALRGRALVSFK